MSSTPADETRPTTDRRTRMFVVLGAVAVLAYVSDQLTKVVALDVLADGESRPFVGEFIRFKLIGNPGAALSLGAGNTWVMTGIALAVLIAIIVVARQLGSWAWAIALGLLLGAAIGNLTDRFVRPPGGGQGHVVDFIDYNRWFIGNVADIWIVSAAALVVILALLGIGVDGRRDHGRPATRTVASEPSAGDGETTSDSPANGETDMTQQPGGSAVSTETPDPTETREKHAVRRQGDDHA
ncbi:MULTISPECIES: signal peptidase II [unclassified Terrabacter]|uniref:signal peptidase II n=1 Tax=unclassified Terrabacter TaxID=2630222 RepID=UPI001F402ED1|nr:MULTISPECIES: signal peptidase II [unclassified Terrabacter]